MRVFIIILNFNGKKDTLDCLDSLKKLQVANYHLEIIVVDNGSTDKTQEEIKKEIPKFKKENLNLNLIANKKNLGFAEGNNVGIREALKCGADYVMLLNNDTLVDQDLVSQLLKEMASSSAIGIAGPKIYFAPGCEYHGDRYKEEERGKVLWYAGGKIDWQNILPSHRGVDEVDHGQYDMPEVTDFVSGCTMMIKKEVFAKIGLLDQKYFLYFEDCDLCQRAKRAGFKIFYVPRAFLWHKNASSSGKPGSTIHQYYLTRNRFLFGFQYAHLKARLALLKESLKFIKNGGIKQKATLDFYLRRFGGADF